MSGAFAHHDRIAETPKGGFVLACEPVTVTPDSGGRMLLPQGSRLRVKFYTTGLLWVEAEHDRRVIHATVRSKDFGALDRP